MRVANKIKRLFDNLLRRHRVEDSLDAELRAYVDELTDRNIVRATIGEVFDLRQLSRSFEQVSMINDVDANLEYGGEMEHVAAASVSDDFLPLLDARPALGRTLDSRIDEGQDQVLAVVISDELWRRRFSADPGVVGKGVRINNPDVQIAGVLAPGFRLFLPPKVSALEQITYGSPPTLPQPASSAASRSSRDSGRALDQANAELETLAAQFEREYPDFYSGVKGWQASPSDRGPGAKLRLTARRVHDEMTRDSRPALFLLSGAVRFVLLIAKLDLTVAAPPPVQSNHAVVVLVPESEVSQSAALLRREFFAKPDSSLFAPATRSLPIVGNSLKRRSCAPCRLPRSS